MSDDSSEFWAEELSHLDNSGSADYLGDDGDPLPKHRRTDAPQAAAPGAERRAVLVLPASLRPVTKGQAFERLFCAYLDVRFFDRAARLIDETWLGTRRTPDSLVDTIVQRVAAFAPSEISALENLVYAVLRANEAYFGTPRLAARLLHFALYVLHSNVAFGVLAKFVARCEMRPHAWRAAAKNASIGLRHAPLLLALIKRTPSDIEFNMVVSTRHSSMRHSSTPAMAAAIVRALDQSRYFYGAYSLFESGQMDLHAPHLSIAALGRLIFLNTTEHRRQPYPENGVYRSELHDTVALADGSRVAWQRLQRWRYAQYVYPLLQAGLRSTYPLVWTLKWIFSPDDLTELQAVRIVERMRSWYRGRWTPRAKRPNARTDVRLLD